MALIVFFRKTTCYVSSLAKETGIPGSAPVNLQCLHHFLDATFLLHAALDEQHLDTRDGAQTSQVPTSHAVILCAAIGQGPVTTRHPSMIHPSTNLSD